MVFFKLNGKHVLLNCRSFLELPKIKHSYAKRKQYKSEFKNVSFRMLFLM